MNNKSCEFCFFDNQNHQHKKAVFCRQNNIPTAVKQGYFMNMTWAQNQLQYFQKHQQNQDPRTFCCEECLETNTLSKSNNLHAWQSFVKI